MLYVRTYPRILGSLWRGQCQKRALARPDTNSDKQGPNVVTCAPCSVQACHCAGVSFPLCKLQPAHSKQFWAVNKLQGSSAAAHTYMQAMFICSALQTNIHTQVFLCPRLSGPKNGKMQKCTEYYGCRLKCTLAKMQVPTPCCNGNSGTCSSSQVCPFGASS